MLMDNTLENIEKHTKKYANIKNMTDDEKIEHLRKLKQARDRRRYIKNKYIKEQKKHTEQDTEQDTDTDTEQDTEQDTYKGFKLMKNNEEGQQKKERQYKEQRRQQRQREELQRQNEELQRQKEELQRQKEYETALKIKLKKQLEHESRQKLMNSIAFY